MTNFNLKFEPSAFVSALPEFLYGMIGVFFVLACIMCVIFLLKAFASDNKKIATVISVILAVLLLTGVAFVSFSRDKGPVFRDVSWGMTQEQVKAAEQDKGYMTDLGYSIDNIDAFGSEAKVTYTFKDEALSSVTLLFEETDTEAYETLLDALKEEYKTPIEGENLLDDFNEKKATFSWETKTSSLELVYDCSGEDPRLELTLTPIA